MGGREVKQLSIEKQIYLCKYHEVDNCLHLGITAKQRDEILKKLKENGLYKQYRMLNEDEYEHIIKQEKKKEKELKKNKKKAKENTEKLTKDEETISSQFIENIDNTYVKVSVRTVAEWAYQKRIFRQNDRGKISKYVCLHTN